ncbi:MAG: hypothetical protein F9K23_17135 [Bacteroidetes bacterium]|nr:MAG: hypothetical protein F9K23_17135 [Bacteroidota bacterium]
MKTIIHQTTKLAVICAMFTMTVFSSCKQDPVPPPDNGNGKGDCKQSGRLAYATCTASIFNDLCIVPDNEDVYLVPCESTAGSPQFMNENEPINFSYEEIPAEECSCRERIVCTAVPDKPVKYVRITCIEQTPVTIQH